MNPPLNPIINLKMLPETFSIGEYIAIEGNKTPGDSGSESYEINFPIMNKDHQRLVSWAGINPRLIKANYLITTDDVHTRS